MNDIRWKLFFDGILVGFAMIPFALVLHQAGKNREICVGSDGVLVRFQSPVYRRRYRIPRIDVQVARRQEAYALVKEPYGKHPCRGLELIYRDGSIVFPVDSDAEGDWLVDVVNDELRSTKGTPDCAVPDSSVVNSEPATPFHRLNCPTCGGLISAGNLALNTGLAKCIVCDELFLLESLIPDFANPKREIPTPVRPFNARATIESSQTELVIRITPVWPRNSASIGCGVKFIVGSV